MKRLPLCADSPSAANPSLIPIGYQHHVLKRCLRHLAPLRGISLLIMCDLPDGLETGRSFRSYCRLTITWLILSLGLTSCIYDAPGDRFFRTLWVSEEEPFSGGTATIADWGELSSGRGSQDENLNRAMDDMPGGKITIDFLCDGNVTVYATGATGSFGTYDFHGNTAYFSNLRLTYMIADSPLVIVLEEAHRTDNLLLISWHYSGSAVSYTTRLVRKGSYD